MPAGSSSVSSVHKCCSPAPKCCFLLGWQRGRCSLGLSGTDPTARGSVWSCLLSLVGPGLCPSVWPACPWCPCQV